MLRSLAKHGHGSLQRYDGRAISRILSEFMNTQVNSRQSTASLPNNHSDGVHSFTPAHILTTAPYHQSLHLPKNRIVQIVRATAPSTTIKGHTHVMSESQSRA
jgi:hypothetical protein